MCKLYKSESEYYRVRGNGPSAGNLRAMCKKCFYDKYVTSDKGRASRAAYRKRKREAKGAECRQK